ncbi:DUF6233 domain-containing protein [Streptomyces sp. NPDC060049]
MGPGACPQGREPLPAPARRHSKSGPAPRALHQTHDRHTKGGASLAALLLNCRACEPRSHTCGRRSAEQALSAARAARSPRRPPRKPPAWLIEHGIGASRLPVRVHAGDCWDTTNRCSPLSTEEAHRALAEGVPGCPQCRPDVALGVLECAGTGRVEG